MKLIFTTTICLVLLLAAKSSKAQSDSSRYADCQGAYQITTPTFPVSGVTIYWQDTTLAYEAGGAKGPFKHQKNDKWHFVNDDHEGTVTFTKNQAGKVTGILIFMDGQNYEGTKEAPVAKQKQ